MINILVQLSKYIIIALMAAYTFSCFSVFARDYEDEERRVLTRQDILLFLMQFIAFAVMYLTMEDMRILFIYAALMVILLAVILLYNLIYPSVSRLIINNMCMLITVGMIMITRLSADNETRVLEYGFSTSVFSNNRSIPISVAPATIEPRLQDVIVKPFSVL